MPRTRDEALLRAVGAQIQRARVARGLTQEALAERVGVDLTTLSKWESGARAPSISSLALVGEALSVSLVDFFDFDGEQPPAEGDPEVVEGASLLAGMEPERRALAVRLLREMARR